MTMMNNEDITPTELRAIIRDYLTAGTDTFQYDDEEQALFSNVHRLGEAERIILFLYAELASERELAKVLKTSRTTVRKILRNIRSKIVNE